MLVGIVGPKNQSSTLARQLAKHGDVESVSLGGSLDSMRSDLARRTDLVHFVYAPVAENLLSQRNLLALAIIKKPVIFHWIGSDVLNAIGHPTGKVVARFSRCDVLVKLHLTQTDWLAHELSEVGIRTTVFPLLPDLDFEIPPLPAGASVLSYLPDSRYEFYGGKILERLAAEFPNVRFLAVAGSRRSRLSNLRYLPWQANLDEIWRDTSILLRLTTHDGLPWMVLEALAKGRQVIFSYQFPFCYRARSFDEARTKLSEVLTNQKLNIQGAAFVRQNFDPGMQIKRLVALYQALLA